MVLSKYGFKYLIGNLSSKSTVTLTITLLTKSHDTLRCFKYIRQLVRPGLLPGSARVSGHLST